MILIRLYKYKAHQEINRLDWDRNERVALCVIVAEYDTLDGMMSYYCSEGRFEA